MGRTGTGSLASRCMDVRGGVECARRDLLSDISGGGAAQQWVAMWGRARGKGHGGRTVDASVVFAIALRGASSDTETCFDPRLRPSVVVPYVSSEALARRGRPMRKADAIQRFTRKLWMVPGMEGGGEGKEEISSTLASVKCRVFICSRGPKD